MAVDSGSKNIECGQNKAELIFRGLNAETAEFLEGV